MGDSFGFGHGLADRGGRTTESEREEVREANSEGSAQYRIQDKQNNPRHDHYTYRLYPTGIEGGSDQTASVKGAPPGLLRTAAATVAHSDTASERARAE